MTSPAEPVPNNSTSIILMAFTSFKVALYEWHLIWSQFKAAPSWNLKWNILIEYFPRTHGNPQYDIPAWTPWIITQFGFISGMILLIILKLGNFDILNSIITSSWAEVAGWGILFQFMWGLGVFMSVIVPGLCYRAATEDSHVMLDFILDSQPQLFGSAAASLTEDEIEGMTNEYEQAEDNEVNVSMDDFMNYINSTNNNENISDSARKDAERIHIQREKNAAHLRFISSNLSMELNYPVNPNPISITVAMLRRHENVDSQVNEIIANPMRLALSGRFPSFYNIIPPQLFINIEKVINYFDNIFKQNEWKRRKDGEESETD